MRGKQDPRAALDVLAVGPHQLEHVVEALMVERVDVVVTFGDLPRTDRVDLDERTDDPMDELGNALTEKRKLDGLPERRGRRELPGLLRDRAGVVPHSLELIPDVVEREEEAQVACDRRLRGDRC